MASGAESCWLMGSGPNPLACHPRAFRRCRTHPAHRTAHGLPKPHPSKQVRCPHRAPSFLSVCSLLLEARTPRSPPPPPRARRLLRRRRPLLRSPHGAGAATASQGLQLCSSSNASGIPTRPRRCAETRAEREGRSLRGAPERGVGEPGRVPRGNQPEGTGTQGPGRAGARSAGTRGTEGGRGGPRKGSRSQKKRFGSPGRGAREAPLAWDADWEA